MSEAATYITLDKKGRATLPEEVRTDLGLAEGDLVILEKTARGTYELVPASLVPKVQLWFYHPEMQKRVIGAEREIRDKKGTRTESIAEAESMLSSLRRSKSTALRKRPRPTA